MKYISISSGRVNAIYYDNDPVFPGIPVSRRMPLSQFSSLVPVEDDMDVSCGMVYKDGEFHDPTPDDDPSQPIPENPTGEHQSYAEKLDSLTAENALLKAQVQAQTDRSDFLEDCIAEMAMLVYAE